MQTNLPSFTLVADNALETVSNFTKPEAMVFIILKDLRDYETNYSRFGTSVLSNTDKVVFSKGLKLLMSKNLVIRTKKGRVSTYLFNPDFILPSKYEPVKLDWDNQTSTA